MPPVARQGDPVQGTCNHLILVPTPSGAVVPTVTPLPFAGMLHQQLSADVKVNGRYAATVGSVAPNQPQHLPVPPNGQFAAQPGNRGQVLTGSATVKVNGNAIARTGDPVMTCNEPPGTATGAVGTGSPDVTAA